MRPALKSTRRDRILHGAAEAIARHGLGKLGMGDVSSSAAVSRGTLYRYFSNRDELVAQLAESEGRRFQERMLEELQATSDGAERVRIALQYSARFAGEHPVLRRLAETDPAYVLGAIRDQFETIRRMLHGPLAPLLAQTDLVRLGIAPTERLVDWMTRLMISYFLFPEPDPDRMARDLAAVFSKLTGARTAQRRAAPSRKRARTPARPQPRTRTRRKHGGKR